MLNFFVIVFAMFIGALVLYKRYQSIRSDRALYYRMPLSERALLVKSMLFILHNGPTTSVHVADALDLNLFTVDEALRRLIRHGYVRGIVPTSILNTLQAADLTPKGKEFYDGYYGSTGDVYNVAPWGVVVNKSTLIDTQVKSGDSIGQPGSSPSSISLPDESSPSSKP